MIQKELLNELSRQIIAGTLEMGTEHVIDPADAGQVVFDGKIVVRKPITKERMKVKS